MKRYGCCLLLACLITPSALAQRRFSVAATAAPVVSHTNSTFNYYLPDPGSGLLVPATYTGRSTIGGYLIGLSGQYAISANWSVSTGFWYNRFISTGPNPFDPNLTTVRIIGQTVQIPLLLNYRLTTKRLSPYFSAGGLASFRQPTLYHPEAGSGQDDFKLLQGKAVVFSAMLGAGAAYRINRHLSLTVQPLLTWRFKPNSSYDKFVSYQLNGQTQLMYTF